MTGPPAVELVIESLAAGGDGVGRAPDGRVVFVPLAAPGDRVRVRLVEERPRFARGEIEALLAPGPGRVEPRCPVFGVCGGCAWQHLAYAAQVEAKHAIVRAAFERIAGLAELPPLGFTPSPAPYGYRGRARVRVERGAVGFRRRRSHALCAVTGCPLLAPPLGAALAALAAAPPKPAGDWELALGEGGAVRAAPLAARPGALAGERLALRAGSERLELSPGVFAQANALLLDALAGAVLGAAGAGASALELYAGAGFFTLGLARRFERVVALESDPAAARDLARNAAAAAGGGPRRVRVVEARVEPWLAAGEALALAPEVVVLDPPRGGVGPAAAEALARLSARRLVHLSCDPATLARDVAVLAERGWRLASLHGFDLFPQTPHVETLAVLVPPGATLASSPAPP
ncbi:MAG: TRAM domain-containing protein [Deltaproteobacteria bacterium]|nr:TRAM domain-containing protein [Deltaproteobacteria bacterium]